MTLIQLMESKPSKTTDCCKDKTENEVWKEVYAFLEEVFQQKTKKNDPHSQHRMYPVMPFLYIFNFGTSF